MVRVVIALLLMMLVPAAAFGQSRHALLIGNQGYNDKVGALKNPHNDIAAVGKSLEAVGFKVSALREANRRQVLSAVKSFGGELAKAGPNAVGFFYYSGHGISRPDDKANYLIPVDLKDTESADFWFDAVKLDDILGELERAAPFAAHFIVFDACRNELKLPEKSAVKGFEPVAERSGMFIAFATALGAVASDRGAASGPYAQALASELVKPGQDHLQLFQNVKEGVFSSTGRRQVPWERNGLLRRVYFGGEATKQPEPSQPQASEVEGAWKSVEASTDIRDLEAFRSQYGKANPFYDRRAEKRIAELKKPQVAIAEPPKPKPASPKQPVPAARCDGVDALIGNERRCLKPGAGGTDWFKDCPKCPEMVVAPAGRFTMGSPKDEPEREPIKGWEEDQLAVTIAKPFAVGRFAVTRGEFAAFVTATGHKTDGGCSSHTDTEWKLQVDLDWRLPGFTQNDRHPVVCVNWDDAKAYVAWLASTTDNTYRLLSEAEREYVARAGSTTPFWWGSTISASQANYNGSYTYAGGSKGESRRGTVPVDSFAANSWGLYNVHGNVLEWTEDCWSAINAGNPGDSKARRSGDCSRRVLRGGSWLDDPRLLRSAVRGPDSLKVRRNSYGFRIARTLAAPARIEELKERQPPVAATAPTASVYWYARPWVRQPYYGKIVADVTLGHIYTVAVVGSVPLRPAPNLCWYWADKSKKRGYWDYC